MMKNFFVIGILFISVFFIVGCSHRNSDESYLREIEIKDAFVFENDMEYVVGDTIYVQVNFSRYLPENGYTNLLDIYETTGSKEFNYSFTFSKYSEFSNSYSPIKIADEYIFASKGKLVDEWNNVIAVFNSTNNMYESEVAIILAEAGEYSVLSEYYYLSLYPADIASEHVYLSLIQNFDNANFDDYSFTVVD